MRTQTGTTRISGIIKGAIGSAAVAGLLGGLIGSLGENGLTNDDGWTIFAAGTIAGTAFAAAREPSPRYEDRVVYIRP